MLPKHANIRLAFTVVSVVPTTFSKPEVKGQTTLMYLLLTVLVAQQLTFNQSIASRQYCLLSASIVCSSRQVEDCTSINHQQDQYLLLYATRNRMTSNWPLCNGSDQTTDFMRAASSGL